MNIFRRLMFDLWYLRHPPWESGIVPPEVEEFIRENPAGRALDLGCGSGTSSLRLAGAGWTVTGVDFARRAIHNAKEKAHRANLSIDFQIADVTHLPEVLFAIPYELILDIGCFHGLSPTGKTAYITQMGSLLTTGGTWLLYGFFKPSESPGPGLTGADVESIPLQLIKRQDGLERKTRPSAWLWFQKK